MTTVPTQTTTAPASTLNFDGFRFEELHVAPLAEGETGRPPDTPAFVIDYDLFTHPEHRNRFAVGLKIVAWTDSPETNDADALQLEIRVRAVGFLTSTDELPPALPLPVAVNGLALLYGIIRGVISTTGAWFGSTALLPTVNFSRMVRERTRADEDADPPTPGRHVAAGGSKRRRRKIAASEPPPAEVKGTPGS